MWGWRRKWGRSGHSTPWTQRTPPRGRSGVATLKECWVSPREGVCLPRPVALLCLGAPVAGRGSPGSRDDPGGRGLHPGAPPGVCLPSRCHPPPQPCGAPKTPPFQERSAGPSARACLPRAVASAGDLLPRGTPCGSKVLLLAGGGGQCCPQPSAQGTCPPQSATAWEGCCLSALLIGCSRGHLVGCCGKQDAGPSGLFASMLLVGCPCLAHQGSAVKAKQKGPWLLRVLDGCSTPATGVVAGRLCHNHLATLPGARWMPPVAPAFKGLTAFPG